MFHIQKKVVRILLNLTQLSLWKALDPWLDFWRTIKNGRGPHCSLRENQWIFNYISIYSKFSWEKYVGILYAFWFSLLVFVFFSIFSQLDLFLLLFICFFFFFFLPKKRTQFLLMLRGKRSPLVISNSCLAAKVRFNSTEIMWGFSMFPKRLTVVSLL